jgi:hypothetical protein
MKFLTRTIIVLAVFNLATGSFALAEKDDPSETGKVTISGSVGLSGVMLKGLPDNPVTGWPGTYKDTLEYGWSGTVTPVREGYTFEPSSRTYSKVTKNYYSQDYTAKMITFTISGTTGIGGVVMNGLPGNPVSDERGYYSATVGYGWSGRVMPVKEGYTFEPATMIYRKITNNQDNQNYVAELITYTISEVIFVGGRPIQGVRVSANNGGGSDVTDAQGWFSVKVPYGWSGEITLEKEGFRLPSKSYTNVTKNIKDVGLEPPRRPSYRGSRGRIMTTAQPYEPAVGRTGGRKVLVIPDSKVEAEDLDAITQDLLVMSHILDERFKGSRTIKGMFTDFGDFFGRDNRSTEAIYMQGYGVVFLMEVNFAFSPPLKPEVQKDEETAEQVDPTWQRAREQIFSPRAPRPGMPGFSGQGPGLVEFDQLKGELIETLKHAANIRNLSPDEWIILTVIGQGRQGGVMYFSNKSSGSAAPRSNYSSSYSESEQSASSEGGGYASSRSSGVAGGGMGPYGGGMMGGYGGGMGGYGGGMGGYGGGMMGGMGGMAGYDEMMGGMGRMGGMAGMGMGMGGMYGGMGFPSSTILTIRAKKSDVSDFATGELDFEQFQETVEIFNY